MCVSENRRRMTHTAIVFLALIAHVGATVTICTFPGDESVDLKAYNGVPWKIETPEPAQSQFIMPLIAIDTHLEGEYNPCDDTTFSLTSMDSVLEGWWDAARNRAEQQDQSGSTTTTPPAVAAADDDDGLTEEAESPPTSSFMSGNASSPWIAYLDVAAVEAECGGTKLHWYYSPFAVLAAQKLGASGLIVDGAWFAESYSVSIPPEVDIESKSVRDTVITIPVLMIDQEDQNMVLEQLLKNKNSYFDSDDGDRSLLLTVTVFDADENSFSGVWAQFGIFYWVMMVMAAYCIPLAGFILKHVVEVIRHYRSKKRHTAAETMAFVMRLLILIPEFVAAIDGMFAFADPNGVFLNVDFYSARMLFGSRGAIAGTTDIILIVYCTDMFNAFKSSRKNTPYTPFFTKHCWGLPVTVILGVTMIATDLVISYFSVRGAGSANASLITAIYLLTLYFVGSIVLLVLSSKIQKETNTIDVENKNATDVVVGIVNSTLLMKKFMLWSVVGRFGCIAGFIVAATGGHSSSPVAYAITVACLLVFPSLVSSTAQVLIAVEITPSTRRKVKTTTLLSSSKVSSPGVKSPRRQDGTGATRVKGTRSPRKVKVTRGGVTTSTSSASTSAPTVTPIKAGATASSPTLPDDEKGMAKKKVGWKERRERRKHLMK